MYSTYLSHPVQGMSQSLIQSMSYIEDIKLFQWATTGSTQQQWLYSLIFSGFCPLGECVWPLRICLFVAKHTTLNCNNNVYQVGMFASHNNALSALSVGHCALTFSEVRQSVQCTSQRHQSLPYSRPNRSCVTVFVFQDQETSTLPTTQFWSRQTERLHKNDVLLNFTSNAKQRLCYAVTLLAHLWLTVDMFPLAC